MLDGVTDLHSTGVPPASRSILVYGTPIFSCCLSLSPDRLTQPGCLLRPILGLPHKRQKGSEGNIAQSFDARSRIRQRLGSTFC